jgi:hypothetical protein
MGVKTIGITLVLTGMLVWNGCAPRTAPPPLTYFPIQNQSFTVYPALGIEGILILENGILRISPVDNTDNTSHLPIWPIGFSWRAEDGIITVINNKNEAVARVGDKIGVGGGNVALWVVDRYTFPPVPKDCPGPYWLASGSITDYTWDLEKSWQRLGLPEN